METRRTVLGMSRADGVILGIRLLETLRGTDTETHLIVNEQAERTVALETEYTVEKVKTLTSMVYAPGDMTAHISSDSFLTDEMVVYPYNVKTLTAIASGFSHNLITRCTDVSFREGRKLLLVPHETPLSAIHLGSLLKFSRLGIRILPLCIGFYIKLRTVEEIVSHLMGKILDMLEIGNHMYRHWGN